MSKRASHTVQSESTSLNRVRVLISLLFPFLTGLKAKERTGAHGHADDEKFAGSWRREGPLPDLGRRERETSTRRRYEGLGSENKDTVPDNNENWRSHRAPPRFPVEPEAPPIRRRGSGFSTPTQEGEASPADAEEKWAIGAKFKASHPPDERSGGRFGSMRGRGDMGPPPSVADETSSWRKPRGAGGSPSRELMGRSVWNLPF